MIFFGILFAQFEQLVSHNKYYLPLLYYFTYLHHPSLNLSRIFSRRFPDPFDCYRIGYSVHNKVTKIAGGAGNILLYIFIFYLERVKKKLWVPTEF